MSLAYIDHEVLPLLSQLMDLRLGRSPGHQIGIAELARRISVELRHAPALAREIHHATLLCHIGFIALPDLLIKCPYAVLTPENRQKVDHSAIDGAAMLASTSILKEGAGFIKHQYEQFDGKGYPDKLKGEEIPIGSRILAVVVDYDDLQSGNYFGKRLDAQRALSVIQENAGKKFDPAIVEVFTKLNRRDQAEILNHAEVILSFEELEEGMVLAQDVVMNNGIILLRKEKTLSSEDIAALDRVNKLYPSRMVFFVRT